MTAQAAYFGLILARVAAFVAVMPLFGNQTPRLVRVGLALALTWFYIASTPPGWDADFAAHAAEIHAIRYGIAIGREAVLGAAFGFAFAFFLLPARIAGEFITGQIGLNVSPHIGVTGADPAGPLTQIFETIAGLLFLCVNGHHVVISALHSSFTILPLGGTSLPTVAPAVDGVALAYDSGLTLAGPLAACLFLLAITLAVMARTAPQLNVYNVGFTLQILVVLFGGLFLVPELVATMTAILERTSSTLPRMLGG